MADNSVGDATELRAEMAELRKFANSLSDRVAKVDDGARIRAMEKRLAAVEVAAATKRRKPAVETSMSVALSDLDAARKVAKTVRRGRNVAVALTSMLGLTFCAGLTLSVWSSLHHFDAHTACLALMLPSGLVGLVMIGVTVLMAFAAAPDADNGVRRCQVAVDEALDAQATA